MMQVMLASKIQDILPIETAHCIKKTNLILGQYINSDCTASVKIKNDLTSGLTQL